MKKFFLPFLLMIFISLNVSYPQDSIKAKIAILHKYGDQFNALKNKDRVRAGEMIRVFVQPANESYIYVVYSDKVEAALLYEDKKLEKKETLILPDENDFYTFDDKSPEVKVVVFCSLKPIKEIENLFKNSESVAPAKWDIVEKKLIESQRKKIEDETDKPFSIAGKVSADNEDFLKKVQGFVGSEMLIRKYELEIKK